MNVRRSARLLARLLTAVAWATGSVATVAAQQSPAADATRDLIRAAANEQPPWLAFNTPGHTAGVRALAFTPDGRRICSAGLDKIVCVWNAAAATRDLQRTWLLERTIRWQVGRGLRGAVYALASAPSDGLLALAGYGAMGSLGEILLVDPAQGTLTQVLKGHEQTIVSLAFSADGQWLASLDMDGRCILWQRGDWRPVPLYDTDAKVYGAARAGEIARQARLRPLAMLASQHLLLPVAVKSPAGAGLQWKLQRINLSDRKDTQTLDVPHAGMVTALAASADGKQAASADAAGKLWLWDLNGAPKARELASGAGAYLSLAFDPQGARLLAGAAADPKTRQGRVQMWDVATGQAQAERLLPGNVNACAFGPDGARLAFASDGGHQVWIGMAERFPQATPQGGAERRVERVAWVAGEPPYRLTWAVAPAAGADDPQPVWQSVFDAQALELGAPAAEADRLAPPASVEGWRLTSQPGGAQLYRGERPQGRIELDPQLNGGIRCHAWLTDDKGQPRAVAVGTNLQHSIYVFGLAERGRCPLWRHFRGHSDEVTSLAASPDGKLLLSGAADSTVRVWSLAEMERGATPLGRWGAAFQVDAAGLKAVQVHPAGPLHFKGIRDGDVVEEIAWRDAAGEHLERRPKAMLDQLQRLSWFTQVVFRPLRADRSRQPFQLLPAWQPLASLLTTQRGEWAYWTPSGYYDASANGHLLFGWLVNRGLEKLPDFYRADQFKRLERPDVLEHLLPAGSLEGAFQAVAAAPPDRPDQVLSAQIGQTPRVSILSPKAGETVPQNSALVRARIELPAGGQLAQVKAYAGGVIAPTARVMEQAQVDGSQSWVYEWQANLPAEPHNLIQVVAGTAAETASFEHVLIERGVLAPAERQPRLFLLAVGIDEYADSEVQPLAWSVADAKAVVELLAQRAGGSYALEEPLTLLNDQVTRARWQESFADLSERLRTDARADDLLVIFMAGHGFVDGASQKYYYASYDITRQDFERGSYGGSISWSDFELLADVPCRKLAFLDTCHSGAIQPLRDRNLKAAFRALAQDVVFTVAASAGHERSEERAEWGHGAFTKTLLEALSGEADSSGDGQVGLDEVVSYVEQAVPQLTEGRQHPVAAPADLLPFVSLRLTKAGDLAPAGSGPAPQ